MWSRGRRSYEGAWLKGRRGGRGVEKWPNGDVYEGAYVEGQFHGHGALRTRIGKYVGDFEGGLKHGNGRMEWYSGDVRWDILKYYNEGGECVNGSSARVYPLPLYFLAIALAHTCAKQNFRL